MSSSGATFFCPRSANGNKILCIIQSIFFTSLSFLERVESDVQTLFCKFHNNCTHVYQKGFPLCVDFKLNTTLQGQTRNLSLWNFAHENKFGIRYVIEFYVWECSSKANLYRGTKFYRNATLRQTRILLGTYRKNFP